MQSITLQTGDTIVTSGDKLGQLQFAASAESDGGAAVVIAGSLYSQAEGSFTSSSNPTSLVLSTAAADASAAVGRIKVTDNGHLLPMTNNSYDLGDSGLNFRNSYFSEGVVLSSNTPSVTTNKLYNDGGTLKFNGSTVGGGTYTAGSGLTLSGTQFNVYGGSGNFQYLEVNTSNNVIPKIEFTGSGVTDTPINLEVASSFESATGSGSALLFQGTQGQLFSITDNLSSGTIFSVSDITGLPMLEIDASGHVQIGEFADDITIHQPVLLSGGVPSSTTNKLYNNAGTLYWNGSTLTYNDAAISGYFESRVDTNETNIALKANIASPTFTGTPAAPTASAGTNTTQIATTAFVSTAVANLVDSAPTTLDTLNELAAALGDDANFSTTVTNSIATKLANVVEDTTPQLGGTLDANGNTIDMGTYVITDAKVGQWDTAYGWGNHASAGYLTSETSHADVVVDGDFGSQGLMKRGATAGSYSIITDNSSNWNTAYSWGDHASAGYLTAHPTISAASSSDNSGRTYIQDVILDSNGHVTGLATATETVTDTTYTAGSGLTLVGTEFNIHGGSGHFHEIIFNSGEQSTTDSWDGIRILTPSDGSNQYFPNIKIGGGLDLYTATGSMLLDNNVFIGYNIASGLDNTGYNNKPYHNVLLGNSIAQNCAFIANSMGIGYSNFKNSNYVASAVGIGVGCFNNTNSVVNSVGFNGVGGSVNEISESFLWGGLCTTSATVIKDTIGMGYGALYSASGRYNLSLGYVAGYNMKGNNNVSIDQNTGFSTVIGTNSNKLNLCQVIVGDHSNKLLAIGNVGSADLTPDATLEIKPKATTDVGLIVQAATSHSASLQEWQNSSETKLLAVGPDGGLELPNNVPSTTTNKLYNDGGTLKFNGSAIGGGSSYTAGSGLTLVGTEFNVHGGSGHFINLDVDGAFTAVTKSFLIDHPSKEGMKLQYASLEGPENGVYVRGTTKETFITLPDYWRDLVHNSSITVTLTPVGSFQPLFVESKSSREIIVGGVCGYYDYVVWGERKDVDKLEVEW